MEYNCPKCNNKVFVGKEKLVTCNKCSSKLLLATLNGEKILYDLTPREAKIDE